MNSMENDSVEVLQRVSMNDPAVGEIRTWPSEIRVDLGAILLRIQMGLPVGLPDVNPMPTVSKNVSEIRLKDQSGLYRVCFRIKKRIGVIVFHAFKSKSKRITRFHNEMGLKYLMMFLYGGTPQGKKRQMNHLDSINADELALTLNLNESDLAFMKAKVHLALSASKA